MKASPVLRWTTWDIFSNRTVTVMVHFNNQTSPASCKKYSDIRHHGTC